MRTMIVGATFLVIGAGAAGVGALDNVNMSGSDTLEDITKDLLAQCPNATAAGIAYFGGGSTTGENAMVTGTAQTTAPMSRFLNPTAGVCAKGATAEGIVIALDGLSVVASGLNGNACGGGLAFSGKSFAVTDSTGNPVVDCTGCNAGTNTYTISGAKPWQDVIALVFAGKPHAGATDCASPVRRSLVDNWGNLFQAGCAGSTCTNLKHAFRRADLSGTTDTFVTLVGLPSMPLAQTAPGAVARAIPFCNAHGAGAGNLFGGGSDFLDLDPIRRPCEANEQVCGRTGTLGLVTVVEIPANISNAQNFPTANCQAGKFALMTPRPGTAITVCPNGLGKLFNKCFQPYIDDGDNIYDPPSLGGTDNANCIALRTPVQGFQANGTHGRAYNLYVKNVEGLYQLDNLNRPVVGATFRIHSTQVLAGGGAPCNSAASATAQIGCLVQANPCSVGFAGREAAQQAGTMSLSVNGLPPSVPNIEALVTTPANPADDYVLARKLYFNTLNGFEAVTGGELELAKCFGDNAKIGPIASGRGFVPMPGGVVCEDFNETACAGAPANNPACGNNPAGIPQ